MMVFTFQAMVSLMPTTSSVGEVTSCSINLDSSPEETMATSLEQQFELGPAELVAGKLTLECSDGDIMISL